MDLRPMLIALVFLAAPTVWASDDPAHGHLDYVTGAAVNLLTVQTPPMSLCSDDCPADLPPMGGGVIAPDGGGMFHEVLVQFTDEHWGENAAYRVCPIIADPPQPACGFDAFVGCGTSVMFVPIVHMAAIEVEIYALNIGPDLTLCGSTTGSVLAAFYEQHAT